jgi:uncharacterized membrane protein
VGATPNRRRLGPGANACPEDGDEKKDAAGSNKRRSVSRAASSDCSMAGRGCSTPASYARRPNAWYTSLALVSEVVVLRPPSRARQILFFATQARKLRKNDN